MSESLRDRLARRREELQQERTFTLPVTGYEDLGLHATYRALGYDELRKIGKRHEKQANTIEGEVASAADTLIVACVELVERDENRVDTGTGQRWTTQAASELFGLDLGAGDEATARMAIRAVLPDTALMLHFRDYDEKLSKLVPEVQEAVQGESEPSEEG